MTPNSYTMLKRTVILLLMLLCTFVCRGEERIQKDTAVLNALSSRLAEYFEAMKYEPLEVQKEECDFLIESSSDSLIMTHIAQTAYSHFADSPVMGAEAVAVHIYDKWFQTGVLKMQNDMELLGAKIFADFNRQSLLGCKAPELNMSTFDGSRVELFTDGEQSKGFRVLYFYDTDCSKCRLQTILLRNILSTETYPIEFYAIYTGDKKQDWGAYIKEQWVLDPVSAQLIHLWDPEIDSDFQRKYGILQTPRMFLVAPDGTIVGRGLDAVALAQMLHGIFAQVELNYGSEESTELFDGLFAIGGTTKEDVKEIADHIAASTLPKGDTVMFRQMTGDLLYYLSTHSGEDYKEGLAQLIEERILSQDRIWRSSDDSLKVVGFARIIEDLLSKSQPGTRVQNHKVPGILLTSRGIRSVEQRLSKLRGSRNIIIFYTEGCNICDSQKEAAKKLVQLSAARGEGAVKVYMVNVDELLRSNPSLASRLFDSFDLSSLPFLLETDRKGIIQHRYFLL